MIGKVRALDYASVRSKIDELCVSNMFFTDNTVKLMKEIVPEYVSNNSAYCRLDEKKADASEEPQNQSPEKKIIQL